MNETLARQAIMTVLAQIQTAWTEFDLKIDSENRDIIDQASQQNPYLAIEIDFLGADQMDLSPNPLVRQTGQLVVYAVEKVGSGTARAARLRDFVRPRFSLQNLGAGGTLHCHAAEIYKSKTIAGWEYFPVLVNFWYSAPNV